MSSLAPTVTRPPVAGLLLRPRRGEWARRLTNLLATILIALSALAAVALLLVILGYVLIRGLPAWNVAFFTERPLPFGEVGGGVAPAILGTLQIVGVASLLGVPIGVGTGIYLS